MLYTLFVKNIIKLLVLNHHSDFKPYNIHDDYYVVKKVRKLDGRNQVIHLILLCAQTSFVFQVEIIKRVLLTGYGHFSDSVYYYRWSTTSYSIFIFSFCSSDIHKYVYYYQMLVLNDLFWIVRSSSSTVSYLSTSTHIMLTVDFRPKFHD